MDSSALANASDWLTILWWAKLVAAGFVTLGVLMEFGGDWLSRPFEKTVEEARETEMAKLAADAKSARAETAKTAVELEKAKAQEARADANLLHEQRLTANESWRLEWLERAVKPRSAFVDWNRLVTTLKDGHFQPINIAIVGGAEAELFGFNLQIALGQAGMMGRVVDPPTDPKVIRFLPKPRNNNASG